MRRCLKQNLKNNVNDNTCPHSDAATPESSLCLSVADCNAEGDLTLVGRE